MRLLVMPGTLDNIDYWRDRNQATRRAKLSPRYSKVSRYSRARTSQEVPLISPAEPRYLAT